MSTQPQQRFLGNRTAYSTELSTAAVEKSPSGFGELTNSEANVVHN